MRFHEFTTNYVAAKRHSEISESAAEWYEGAISRLSMDHTPFDSAHVKLEKWWYETRRPYYSVWPSIAGALLKVQWGAVSFADLSANIPAGPILIRFPVGAEPITWNGHRLLSMLCFDVANSVMLNMEWDFPLDHNGVPDWVAAKHSTTTPLQSMTVSYTDAGSPPPEALMPCFQLYAGVCMLASDPEFVQPDVLNKDVQKYSMTLDPKYIEKAHRRGKVGWNVGAAFEHIPHYRRPHFGIRWTGKGGAIPKLVPIKGAVVKRAKMTEVPTGYMDEESGITKTS